MDYKEHLIARESDKPGMRGKVNAKCIECIYDDIGGGGSWRKQVENCTSTGCPLYQIRPVRLGSDNE
jgi:hypothetical protein